MSNAPSRCLVHHPDGVVRELAISRCEHAEAPADPPVATIADQVLALAIMARDVVCAHGDLPVDEIARLISHDHIGCVPVIDDSGHPVGMITKFDLVEQMEAGSHPDAGYLRPRLAHELMMPLALTLDDRATVADAALMMVQEDLHHVMIVACSGALIGVVSAKDIVRWLVDNDRAARARE